MSERPFMQLYVSDFIGDTLSLSTEQIGAYLMLLMAMWNAKGSLPNDDAKLARIARLSLKKWKAISAEVMAFFDVSENAVTHNRLTFELQKSERQTESRAAAGAKGGAANALKNNMPTVANATAKPVAGLKHLPEPYRKEGAHMRDDPTEEHVQVFRSQEELFRECEAVSGETVKSYMTKKSWPAPVVAKAVANIKARASPQAASQTTTALH